jgi:hypothetical protein
LKEVWNTKMMNPQSSANNKPSSIFTEEIELDTGEKRSCLRTPVIAFLNAYFLIIASVLVQSSAHQTIHIRKFSLSWLPNVDLNETNKTLSFNFVVI